MPTIPNITSPQVAPAVPPLVKPFSPGAASYGYGLGAGMQDLGGSMANVEWDEQQRTDSSAAMSAYADARALRSAILYDDKTGLARQRGRNYLDAAQAADERWSKGIASISARLSPQQQERFNARMESLRAGFADDLKAGVSQARTDLYDDEMGKAIEQTSLDALSDVNHGAIGFDGAGAIDDTVVQEALEEFEAKEGMLDTYAPHMAEKWGISEAEARDRMAAEYASALHVQTTEALIAKGDDLAAQAYFDKHQDAILDADARLRLTGQTEKGSREAMVEGTATAILGEANQPGKDGLSPSESEKRAAVKAGLEKVPLEHRKAVRDRVDELEAEEAEDVRVAQSGNFDTLHTALQGGTPLDEIERLPMFQKADEGGISPDQRDALRIYSQNKTHGAYAATNPETWSRLTEQLKNDPGAIAKLNVRQLTASGQLAEDDAREVEHWQSQIAKANGGDAGAADGIKGTLTRHQTMEALAAGLSLSTVDTAKFMLQIDEAARSQTTGGQGALTDEQFNTLARRHAVQASVDLPWRPWDKDFALWTATAEDMKLLEAHPDAIAYEDIPQADRDEIQQALIDETRPSTPDDVRLVWIRELRRMKELGQ